MKKNELISIIAVLFLLLIMLGSQAFSQEGDRESPWSLSLDLPVNSKYIWRGLNLVDDPVFQPSVSLSLGGWTANLWANMELTDINLYPDQGPTAGEFTEADYVLDYARTVRGFNLSAGFIHFRFPNTGSPPTTELYGTLSLPVLLSPAVTVYRDIDQAGGTYAALSVGHDFGSLRKLSIGGLKADLSAALSGWIAYGSTDYHQAYFGPAESALSDAAVTAALPMKLGRFWTLTPSIGWSVLLDPAVAESVEQSGNLWFGLSLSL